jgi:hypothetical protein
MLRALLGSWNPNQYHLVREFSFSKLCKLLALTAVLSVALFFVLLLPAFFQADAAVHKLSETTTLTLNASLTQTEPAYLLRNPDVLVTTGDGDAFIVVSPSGITVKKFLFFGREYYAWDAFSSLSTLPASSVATRAAIFLFPSILLWGALALLAIFSVFVLLYTLFTYFILHARNVTVAYADLLKVSLYATLPSMLLFAAIPILRLGLPITIILGFLFVLWLVLSLIGTSLAVEHPKADRRR